MPAPTAPQVGIDFLLQIGGTTVGGQRGGTLSLSADTIDISSKDGNDWAAVLHGTEEWEVSFDGLYLEGATPAAEDGHGAGLEASTDSGTSYTEIEELRSITLEFGQELISKASHDTAKAAARLATKRSWQLNAEGLYVDPEGSGGAGIDVVYTSYENNTEVLYKLTFGSESSVFEGDGRVMSIDLDTPYDDVAAVSYQIMGVGAPTTTTFTNVDSGFDALLTAITGASPSSVTALFTTSTTGASEWTGSAYISSLTLEFPHDGAINVSGTLAGDGAITRQATA